MIKKFFDTKERLISFIGFSSISIIELMFSFIYRKYNLALIWGSFHRLVIFAALVCFIVFISTLHNKFISFVCFTIFCIATVYYFLVAFAFGTSPKNFYFNSPNGNNTLIAEERKGFDDDNCYFYVRKYLIFKERLNNYYISIDSFRPFSEKAYEVNWINENEVDISFNKEGENYITIGENDMYYSYSAGTVIERDVYEANYEKVYKADLRDIVLNIKIMN